MKDILKTFYIAFCLSLFLFIGVYYIFIAPKDSTFSEAENRKLKGLPSFIPAVTGGTLDQETEEYLLDNFVKRNHIIQLSHSFKDLLSIASYEEYLLVAKNGQDGLDNGLNGDDINDILGQLGASATPRPTGTPTSTPTPSASPTPGPTQAPEATATPTLTPTPTPSPTPAEYPPIVPKPEANINDFPQELSNYMQVDGVNSIFKSYSRDNVLAYTMVLNKYAALLPENGKLITTIAPFSTYANKFVGSSKNGFMKSEPIEFIQAFSSDNVFAVDALGVLTKPIQEGYYSFYRTDCHWSFNGAYFTYKALVEMAGKTPGVLHEDYKHYIEKPFLGTIYRDNPSEYLKKNADILEVCEPVMPTELRKITGKDSYKVIPFLDWNAPANDRYCVNLGGPAGPWIYAETDNGQEENCLVIMDSTGLSIFPFLTANYKQVHYYDPRYFDANVVGYSVSEMIQKYNITDIYVIMLDSHTFNSSIIIKDANRQY